MQVRGVLFSQWSFSLSNQERTDLQNRYRIIAATRTKVVISEVTFVNYDYCVEVYNMLILSQTRLIYLNIFFAFSFKFRYEWLKIHRNIILNISPTYFKLERMMQAQFDVHNRREINWCVAIDFLISFTICFICW